MENIVERLWNNNYLVATQIFFMFIPTWGNDPIWLIIFQMGWFNHQLEWYGSRIVLQLRNNNININFRSRKVR